MRTTLHLPHWHFSPAYRTHIVHSDEDAAVLYLLFGIGILAFSVAAIYLYSAGL